MNRSFLKITLTRKLRRQLFNLFFSFPQQYLAWLLKQLFLIFILLLQAIPSAMHRPEVVA